MNLKEIYTASVRETDHWLDVVPHRYTVRDENSRYNGQFAFFDMLPDTNEINFAYMAVWGYFCKDSKYYKNKEMLDLIINSSKAAISKLNDDDTNNMLASNFHTGEQFGLDAISHSLLVFNKYITDDADEIRAHSAYCDLVEHIANGCLNSGFHTPNHRWVETAGLLQARRGLLDAGRPALAERLLDKANRYLAEGVDCDDDGEWSERSAGMYNAHCDNVFLSIYEMTGNEEYYNAVYRNLMLMRYYINSDFSMFTQNSRRKDKGEVGSVQMFYKATTYYADVYLRQFTLAAYLKKDRLLGTIANRIFSWEQSTGRPCSAGTQIFLMYPDMAEWEFEPVDDPIPGVYEKYQPKSNIVRKKTENATYSFLAKNPCFMQIESAGIHLNIRMCSSFFAVAQFFPQSMEKTERGYKMTMKAHGEYKLPLENPDGITTKNYWSIDYSARKAIQQLDLIMSVEAVFVEGGVDLYFSVDGCDKVPTKIEFFINEGLHCEIGNAVLVTKAGANVFSRGDDARIESQAGSVMEISGLFCEHLYAEGMRGSLDIPDGAFSLFATSFTPVQRKISIRVSKANGARMFI